MTDPPEVPGQMSFDDALTQAARDLDALAHKHGHDTEHAAADSMKGISGVIRKRVWELLVEHPDGLTDDEGAALYRRRYAGRFKHGHIDRLTFGRRRHELYRDGLVDKTEDRRATPTGRNAIVWKAVPR